MNPRPKILIVDDEPFNVDYLEQELEDLNCDTISAANGQEALERVSADPPDLVLLDIMMPILDGFDVLARLKANPATRDIPVIVISAMNDIHSVVRGVKLGADDYLPKPFDPVLLQARLSACLEKKRYRDQETEYLRQVERLTGAAEAVERSAFDPASLGPVAERTDALGNLARVFQRMAHEVVAREQRLKRQLEQLRLDIAERQQAAAETAAIYIPMDRRHALAAGVELPDRANGAALFADISGFTPLTDSVTRALGQQRGVEEVTRRLNEVYNSLIGHVHRYGGSVVYFSGDAITCWFEVLDPTLRALACALAMQAAMHQFSTITAPDGTAISLAIKVAVAAGPARRFVVGDPQVQQIDALAGRLLDQLAEAERHAQRGEVLAGRAVIEALGQRVSVGDWRHAGQFAVVTGLAGEVEPAPWPELPPDALPEAVARSWLLPEVYEKVSAGQSALLAELRPAVALFVKFGGLDYDAEDGVGERLDAFVRWAQAVMVRHDGSLLQLTVGDKGSYLYGVFGVPAAYFNDAVHAVEAALELQAPPPELSFITGIQIGLAYGQARAGTQGSATRRTYAALGHKTNLAARLMQAARGGILCDEAVYEAARAHCEFEAVEPLAVKGKSEPVPVFRPLGSQTTEATDPAAPAARAAERALFIDRLSPADQLALKAASVIGPIFSLELLRAIYPDAGSLDSLDQCLQTLEDTDLIVRHEAEATFAFADAPTHQAAYNLMLFAQRRQIHRAIAEWHETHFAPDLADSYGVLAHHWTQAEDSAKAIYYLERAGEQARQRGAYQEAERYLQESLALEARAAVLSADYYEESA